MSRRMFRLTAVALGVFGFSAALTASAGLPNCDYCLQGYYQCRDNSPDAQPSCMDQLFQCEIDNRCEPSFPPD
ncbi:hypothetical protein [Lysobacter enzymogenes]|uniref:hypothetical protein n=1 Tax=Lysobacter enzymogenes TaxID=69 RepID=UPI0019D27E2E|nr:hypothetical protein [Lysobacter enzymogenes]